MVPRRRHVPSQSAISIRVPKVAAMSPTGNSWLNIPARIRDVVAHHFAPEWHGRPLYLMIPGGVAALTSGVWIFFVAKAALVDASAGGCRGATVGPPGPPQP